MTQAKPVPDGKFVIVLRHDAALHETGPSGTALLTTSDAAASVREYRIDTAKWTAHFWGLEVTREAGHPDGKGKEFFPFTNVLSFKIQPNSASFEALHLDYIRRCEHTWITSPQIVPPLTYCEECRVDMGDLARVMDPKTTDMPALVVESVDLDRMSRAFDGRDPFFHEASEEPSSGPTTLVITDDELPEDIQRLVDEQLGDSGPVVDDPDGTEF